MLAPLLFKTFSFSQECAWIGVCYTTGLKGTTGVMDGSPMFGLELARIMGGGLSGEEFLRTEAY